MITNLETYWHAVANPTSAGLIAMALCGTLSLLSRSLGRAFFILLVMATIAEVLPAFQIRLSHPVVQVARACVVVLTGGILLRLVLARTVSSKPFEIPLLIFAIGWLSFSLYLERSHRRQIESRAVSGLLGDHIPQRVPTLGEFTRQILERLSQQPAQME